jgi:Family of unknown function (DUF6151)
MVLTIPLHATDYIDRFVEFERLLAAEKRGAIASSSSRGAKSMTHPIRCHCGKLKGTLNHDREVNRCVCYCTDCQAFARFLKREHEILDDRGGTSIIQTIPANISFTEGIEYLACMRLTANGLLRWYVTCCYTPIVIPKVLDDEELKNVKNSV